MNNPQSLFLSLGEPLPESIKIYGKDYNTVKILNAIEKMMDRKITKNNGKLIRGFNNVSLEFFVIVPESYSQPLQILTKDGCIEIW